MEAVNLNIPEWHRLCDFFTTKSEIVYRGCFGPKYQEINNGFKNKVFSCIPFFEDGKIIEDRPNFIYYPENIRIFWIKHPLVDACSIYAFARKYLVTLLRRCYDSVRILDSAVWGQFSSESVEFYPGDRVVVVTDERKLVERRILQINRVERVEGSAPDQLFKLKTTLTIQGDSNNDTCSAKSFPLEPGASPTWNLVR